MLTLVDWYEVAAPSVVRHVDGLETTSVVAQAVDGMMVHCNGKWEEWECLTSFL